MTKHICTSSFKVANWSDPPPPSQVKFWHWFEPVAKEAKAKLDIVIHRNTRRALLDHTKGYLVQHPACNISQPVTEKSTIMTWKFQLTEAPSWALFPTIRAFVVLVPRLPISFSWRLTWSPFCRFSKHDVLLRNAHLPWLILCTKNPDKLLRKPRNIVWKDKHMFYERCKSKLC